MNVALPHHVPMPGDWDPHYADQRERLTAWLDGNGPQHHSVEVSMPEPVGASLLMQTNESPRELLTMRKCAGWAPYVGRPFGYVWKVAHDQHGRWIAAEARIHYLPDDPRYRP